MHLLVKQFLFFLVFSLLGFTIYPILSVKVNTIWAQDTSTFLPTPAVDLSSTLPILPKINTETLGELEAFKLDQQIKQATRDFFVAVSNNEPLMSLSSKAAHRKTLMKEVIRKYPYVFLGNALPSSYTSQLESNLQSYFESSISLTDVELEVLHEDDFQDHKNSRYNYYLQDFKEKKLFNFFPAEDFTQYISGTILRVNGIRLDDDITARALLEDPDTGGKNQNLVKTNLAVVKGAVVKATDTIGPQRVALILLKAKDTTFTPYYSKEQIEKMILRDELQRFLRETSYGKTWIDEKSKVYGWYELNTNFSIANVFELPREVVRLTDADINFLEFDRIMLGIAVDDKIYGRVRGWGFIGKEGISTSDGYVSLSFSAFRIVNDAVRIAAHELGHNLGVGHANSWDCSDGFLEGNCQHNERGNIFDVMGSSSNLHHFNAYFKEVFGWVNTKDQTILDITESGSYTLQAIEHPQAVVAKVRRNLGHVYYIELRNPIGFDYHKDTFDRINGIHINWQNAPIDTRLLSSSSLKRVLRTDESFHDRQAQLAITNISDRLINVELEKPSCQNYAFDVGVDRVLSHTFNDTIKVYLNCQDRKCILSRLKQEDIVFMFLLHVKNKNTFSCPNVNITVRLDHPWEENTSISHSDWSIVSGGIANPVPAVIIPANVPAGIYTVKVDVENRDTNSNIFSTSRDLEIKDEAFVRIEGDVNRDEEVDIFDLVWVARFFGKVGEGALSADVNHDGVVDIFDLVIVAKNFGKKL